MDMLKLFAAARLKSVPIVVVRTADQFGTAEQLVEATDKKYPVWSWDAACGIVGVNDPGKLLAKAKGILPDNTTNFADAMIAAREHLSDFGILLAHNAQRQLTSNEPQAIATNVQAVANLREYFKTNWRMLVLLAPTFVAPAELEQDVIILDHALPDMAELSKVVRELYASAKRTVKGLADPTPELVSRAVEAMSGLSRFASEQVAAMSFTESGLDVDALWERTRVAVEQTPGLTVWRGRETFSDIVGLEAIKTHLRRRIRSKRPLGVVVWIDEIDKALANVEQDTSGVRMYQLLKLLTEMENNEWPGFVGVGVPGGAKSLVAKALGNEAGVPTIALDLGATESKYVGESEANLLRVLSIIKAVGRGNAYFVATSNAATVMRPELQRRFTDGMWMFDLMTSAERQAAWKFYLKKYGLPAQAVPPDEGWTGAEIRNCCRYAYDTDCSLTEAATLVIPMAQGRATDIEHLRQFANGKFLDASKSGQYCYSPEPMAKQLRAIALPTHIVDALQHVKES